MCAYEHRHMRTALISAAILVFASACAASQTSDGSEGSTAADTVNPTPAPTPAPSTFVQDLKHAYETTGGTGDQNQHFLTDVVALDPSTLSGDAKDNWEMYESSSEEGLINFIGTPIVQKGTFENTTVIYVAGDDSDTGSEMGFYDENGKTIAKAYTGQGEEVEPHENGVDWD